MPTPSTTRVKSFESVRGLAALQVLFLHIFTGFFPGLVVSTSQTGTLAGKIHDSPLFFLYDGQSAVAIFFVLSGVVLTLSFQRNLSAPHRIIAGRILRLGIPAICAGLLAFSVKTIVGSPNIAAGELLNSAWLSNNWRSPDGMWFLFRDVVLNASFLSYQPVSLFDSLSIGHFRDPLSQAYIAPLWTLSWEIYGSILVLLLCRARVVSKTLWIALLCVAIAIGLRNYFICFIAGHLIALQSEKARQAIPGTLFVILGLIYCLSREVFGEDYAGAICQLPSIGTCATFIGKIYGACFLLWGIACSRRLMSIFDHDRLAVLGRLSFPIYLVHWPIVFGIGSFLFLALLPHAGFELSRSLTAAIVLALTFAIAVPFTAVDRIAIRIAQSVRYGRETKFRALFTLR